MRLFAYYAVHTVKNQLKKLFKTWVLVFILVCGLLGGLIGFGAGVLSDAAEEQNAAEQPQEAELWEEEEEDLTLSQRLGVESSALVELAAGAVVLLVFAYEALSAGKNGSKIFLPADVSLLFASPMQPQSVLMFRLMTQLGAALFASVYLLFQLPNLTLNLGLSPWAGLALIAAWVFAVMLGKLLQLFLYLVCSNRPEFKPWISRGVYLLLALVALGFALTWKSSGLDPLNAALAFFNAPASRFIPLWGWVKGFCGCAVAGETLGTLLCLGAILLGGGLLAWLIWQIKADFYEDAMAKSEETAELLARARSEKSNGLVLRKRKKDRADSLRRDGMRHGWGASVFFFKPLYNRFRFARFGFLTKTMGTYLAAAALAAGFTRFAADSRSLTPAALVLAGLCFFRALGNPLEEDTKMDFFVLIPEPMGKKLWYSLLAGTVSCLLDLLPAMLLAVVLLGANPLVALGWLLFSASVDFYAATVGTFIDVSLPKHIGTTIKQFIQILFVYFGLLPDAAVLAVGIVMKHTLAAALIAALVNLALGLLFFALTPGFLEPGGGRPVLRENRELDLRAARRSFSRLGAGAAIFLLAGSLLQGVVGLLLSRFAPAFLESGWGMWIATFAPLYLLGLPLGLLVIRRAPAAPLPRQSMSAGRLGGDVLICLFLMYAGNLLGVLITGILGSLKGGQVVNPLEGFAMTDALLPKLLFMVVLAPVIEEYVFRRQMIDRMHVYGGKLAVVTSALMFGLFHGNLSQFFYAFLLGLVLGTVYLKTGKLRYSISLHMLVNLLGSVVGPGLLQNAGLDQLDALAPEELAQAAGPGLIVFGVYALLLIVGAVIGLVLLIRRTQKLSYGPEPLQLPREKQFSVVWLNAGMLLLVLLCLGVIALSVVQ